MPTSILLRADQVIEEACLLQRMSLFLAPFGHGAMSELSPVSAEKRTSCWLEAGERSGLWRKRRRLMREEFLPTTVFPVSTVRNQKTLPKALQHQMSVRRETAHICA
jgi:hypothetical protein